MKQGIITETDFNKIKSEVRKNKSKTVIFSSSDDEINRKVLEKLPIDILLISQSNRKDFQKQRSSGFNQVMAKIAKTNKIAIGINLDEIVSPRARGKQKADILARVQQNIKLCNKNKLKMLFISPSGKVKRDKYDLKALGLVLGMPTQMLKSLQAF